MWSFYNTLSTMRLISEKNRLSLITFIKGTCYQKFLKILMFWKEKDKQTFTLTNKYSVTLKIPAYWNSAKLIGKLTLINMFSCFSGNVCIKEFSTWKYPFPSLPSSTSILPSKLDNFQSSYNCKGTFIKYVCDLRFLRLFLLRKIESLAQISAVCRLWVVSFFS